MIKCQISITNPQIYLVCAYKCAGQVHSNFNFLIPKLPYHISKHKINENTIMTQK